MPGLSGSDKAKMYAQFGVMRFGASRFGYTSPRAFVSVGGVQRATGGYSVQDLSITKTRSATPNKASFKATGWEPITGMEVIVTIGSINRIKRLFGGTVLSTRESGYKDLPSFATDVIDWNWLLDDAPIYGHFTGSYDEIALALMADAPVGFTVRQVESSLPTVPGGITFTGVKRSAALNRLAKRGSNLRIVQFIDGNKDLYFRVTPSTVLTNPTNIVIGLESLKKFNVSRDIGQIANRVPFEGGGSNAMTEVSIGETILPLIVAPDWWYGDVGGVVISGPQKITYTARRVGGGGSLVGPGASPSSAPAVALAAGAGMTAGRHGVAIAYETGDGISLPSPRAYIDVGVVSPPSSAATAGTPSSGGSMNGGTHRYYPVFRAASGATTAGPVSNAVTAISGESAPGSSAASIGFGDGGLAREKQYFFKSTFYRASDGTETDPGPSTSDVTFGTNWDNGYRTGGVAKITPPSGFVQRVYRTLTDGAEGSTYYRIVNLSDTGTGWWVAADSSLGAAAPTSNNTVKGTCAVTGIPISADDVVTHVDMYREFNSAGASTAKLAFSVTNGTTAGNDTLANASLGATVPSTNTAAANRVNVGLQVGPADVTGRKVYLTEADDEDGDLWLAETVANNVDEDVEIDTADGSLGAAAETVDSSGLEQPSGLVPAGATEIPIAGVAPFMVGGGWAIVGSYVVRFGAAGATELTGIPPTGVGSIPGPINYNTQIAAAPCLIGIPPTGAGSIIYTIQKGDPVNLFVTVEDTDAQAGLQALLGAAAPVVRECPPLQHRRLNRDEAIARATAFVSQRAYPGVSVGPYLSKDMNNDAGLEVNISIIGAPTTVNDTFKIQSVTISNFTLNIPPDYMVTASDELFSVEDLLARDP